MQQIETFNLLEIYEISVVDNKVYWVEAADEWSPHEAGFEDVDPEVIFTDYEHGDGERVDDILVLNRPNQMTGDEEDATRFREELKGNPKWWATSYFVTSLDKKFPVIRYCHSGENTTFREAIYVMLKLGFSWNPDTERFERADIEEESARRTERVKKIIYEHGLFGFSNTEKKGPEKEPAA